jgi:hypothetical protein
MFCYYAAGGNGSEASRVVRDTCALSYLVGATTRDDLEPGQPACC